MGFFIICILGKFYLKQIIVHNNSVRIMFEGVPLNLIEYRCTCGKLLFKGFILISVVEIKCKRCGATKTFKDDLRGSRSFMFTVDGEGTILDVCEGVSALECTRRFVIGKSLFDILPFVKDEYYQEIKVNPEYNSKSSQQKNAQELYQARNNTLLLRDRKIPIESHVVRVGPSSSLEKGASAYHIFNVMKGS